MKNYRIILFAFYLLSLTNCLAENYNITLQLDSRTYTDAIDKVEVFGNHKPLSWDKGVVLQDTDGDGIYSVDLKITSSKSYVKLKFAINGELELQNSDSRFLKLSSGKTQLFVFNEHEKFSRQEIKEITYTEAEIEEDLAVLQRTLTHIHPNIYKFQDSIQFADDFKALEQSIKSNPNVVHAFGEVSKTVNRIKCSHTFTSPWNQGMTIDKALIYQDDKLPISFTRIGKRIFVDKHATSNSELKEGLEIKEIEGVTVAEILTTLADFVSSDGSNYEKKLERLTMTGDAKYELFDLFYPIAFGSKDNFELELFDLETEKIIRTKVPSMSATKRSRIMRNKYPNSIDPDLPWSFEVLNDDVAKLHLSTFALFNSDFDWKNYIDATIEKINNGQIPNLILDIRGNEGGEAEIVKYILKRVISKPIYIKGRETSVRYLTIPGNIKKYISTWDDFPYDFSKKYSEMKNGRYYLKSKYGVPAQTISPMKNGYKGQVYLITDASNSSATHQMAMYCKMAENITLVGQETGGNLLGTNGGYIFFLRLPNSKIEIDIPALGQYTIQENDPRDGGVVPDILVERRPEQFNIAKDFELQAIIDHISLSK